MAHISQKVFYADDIFQIDFLQEKCISMQL